MTRITIDPNELCGTAAALQSVAADTAQVGGSVSHCVRCAMPRPVFLRRIKPSSVSRSLGDNRILAAVDFLAIVLASHTLTNTKLPMCLEISDSGH